MPSSVVKIGNRGAEPCHQTGDRRVRLDAAVHDDAGERRKALRLMGIDEGEQHVGSVRGRDDDDALGQAFEDVLGRHATDHDPQRFSLQQRRVTGVQCAVHRLE